MARARNIKPAFFTNEVLVELPFATRLLFIGLWTLSDRAGRLEDRPKRIKIELFPCDDFDVNYALNELQDKGFIIRYVANGDRYIQVVNFEKHQSPHIKEAPSTIPAPVEHQTSTVQAALIVVNPLLIPDSLNEEPINAALKNSPDEPARSSQPFDALVALCESTGADVSELSESTKKRQLGKAKQLISQGKSVDDIGRCAGYCASQDWRTSAVDLFTVEKEWGKWELDGKPVAAKSRASPNGQQTNVAQSLSAVENVRRRLNGVPEEPANIYETKGVIR